MSSESRNGHASYRRPSVVALASVALLVVGYFVTTRPITSLPPVTSEPRTTPALFNIDRTSAPLALGELACGERVSFPCVVKNDTPTAVTVGPFRTSCECFSVELIESVIPAGEQVTGTLVLDLAKEPQFRGGLMLSAEAPVSGRLQPLTIRLTLNAR